MRRIPESVRRASAALGLSLVNWTSPPFGLSAAERHVVLFGNGMRVFVKGATDPETAVWLANEFHLLEEVGGRFGPEVMAWLNDDQPPVLVTADLSLPTGLPRAVPPRSGGPETSMRSWPPSNNSVRCPLARRCHRCHGRSPAGPHWCWLTGRSDWWTGQSPGPGTRCTI